jgi:hypothetical protein
MRSIVAILLMLSVMGIFLTPGVEDDVDGTSLVSMAAVRGAIGVESNLKNLEHSPVIYPAHQPETAHILVSVMRC